MKVFVGLIEKLHGVSLPFPDFTPGQHLFKEFCSGLLEGIKHQWDSALRGLSADSRKSIAMSLFLFRKCGPSSEPCPLALLEKVCKPSPAPPRVFMEFVEHEVNRLVPPGWDKSYVSSVLSSTVNTTSYSEKRTCEDGDSRSWFLRNTGCGQWDARQSFIEVALTSTEPVLRDDDISRLVVVSSGGKHRALSIPPVRMNYLRPLHKCLYDYLSRYKWLLRGDAKASSFKGFETTPGELFCSGDYESATDNLNQEVQKEILRCVLQNARHVPKGLMVSAMRTFNLRLGVFAPGECTPFAEGRQQSGQMMGNLLSFPLLCLANYITFRYCTMDEKIPVRINGDDIVFRARPEVIERWKRGVSACGLTLSEGKTMVDRRYFTLNSTLFKGCRVRQRLVPFIRSKALFGLGELDSVASIAGRFRSFMVGYGSSKAFEGRRVFLRENSGWIKKSCRSLTKGLGIQVKPDLLESVGLLSRELRYLAGAEKPLPNLKGPWGHLPEGYEIRWVDKETKKRLSRDSGLQAAFIEAAWKPAKSGVCDESRESAYCRGLDLSDAVIVRSTSWTTRMVRLGGKFLEGIYGHKENMHRWIRTRFTKVDWRLKNFTPRKVYPHWFPKHSLQENLSFHREGESLPVYTNLPLLNATMPEAAPEPLVITLGKEKKYSSVPPPRF